MDPLERTHVHVHELIFQHFSVSEVLDFSLVSKKWSNAIGKASLLMNKVWLNVGDRFNEPKKEDLKAFRASKRIYQNFKMSEIENGLQILLFPKRTWKGAQIDIQSFTSFRDYMNLLKIFNDTIEDLEIFDMDIEWAGNEDEVQVLTLSRLKRFRVGFVSSVALKPMIAHHPRLEKLIVEDITDLGGNNHQSSQEMLIEFVQLQVQLTHLSLSSDAFTKIFTNEEIFDFRLRYLLVEFSGNCECIKSKALLENFVKFIVKQEDLRWVTLSEWTCAVTFKKIFCHQKIERISFDYFDCDSKKLDTSALSLDPNMNLTELDFEGENIELNWLKAILEASPKAEKLYFFHIHPELLEYLLLNQKHLKLLKYCSIFKNFKAFYVNLRKVHEDKINCGVQIVEEKFLDLKKIL